MITTTSIGSALRAALPASIYPYIPTLARLPVDSPRSEILLAAAQPYPPVSPGGATRLWPAVRHMQLPVARLLSAANAEQHLRMSLARKVNGAAAAPHIDNRQGAFVSGGAVHGSIIGVNYGTVNTYTDVTVANAGAILNVAAQPTIQRLGVNPRPPRPLRGFLDREAELHALQPELRPGGGAWLHGAPGCGLTTLLRQAANAPSGPALPDGVTYASGKFEPEHLDDIYLRLFNRFYTSDVALHLTPETAQTYLSNTQALFVLDALRLGRDELIALVDCLRSSAVLLAAAGPASDIVLDLPLGGLPRPDAIRLCSAGAPLAADQPAVAGLLDRLCACLADRPLPLVLARCLLTSEDMTLTGLVAALGTLTDEREPLARVARIVLSMLDDSETDVLAALVRVGGPHAELNTLVYMSHLSVATVEHALARLVGLGLVESSGASNYAVSSESLRHALERLIRPGAERERAASFFAAAAVAAVKRGDLAWLEFQRGNLVAAIETSLATGQAAQAGALARSVQPLLVLRGMWGSWGQVIDQAAQAARVAGDPALQAWALHERGTRAGLLGDNATAAAALGEALRLRQSLGDHAGVEASRHNLEYLGLFPPPAPPEELSPPKPRPGRSVWTMLMLTAVLFVIVGALIWLAPPPPGLALAAADDTAATTSDTPVAIDVLANDTIPADALDRITLAIATTPAHGVVAIDPATNLFTYTPGTGFLGTDSFSYQICAAGAACQTAVVAVTVTATATATIPATATIANRPPVAGDDASETATGVAVTIDVLANDRDDDDNLDASTVTVVRNPANGITAVNTENGLVTYTPNDGFAGVDRFTYRVCDRAQACGEAVVIVAVNVINTAPLANDDAADTQVGAAVTIAVLANDTDAQGNLDPGSLRVIQPAANGTTDVQEAGAISYVPTPGFAGADAFTYQICDSEGLCDSATVSISVINTAPVAVDDQASIDVATSVTIDVLANDSDAEGNLDPESLAVVVQAGRGRALKADAGGIIYTPGGKFTGDDSFTYQVCDTAGACSRANVTVTVIAREPDLVVTTLEATESPVINRQGNIAVPVRVVVQNQGNAAADVFKVAMQFTGSRGTFAVAFTVPEQSGIWYPFTRAPLAPGDEVTFEGVVTFLAANAGETVALQAFADSCSGDEFMPVYCRVEESDEDNNQSDVIEITLPSLPVVD